MAGLNTPSHESRVYIVNVKGPGGGRALINVVEKISVGLDHVVVVEDVVSAGVFVSYEWSPNPEGGAVADGDAAVEGCVDRRITRGSKGGAH